MKTLWQLAVATFMGTVGVFGTSVPAQAGYWVVAGYQYDLKTRSDSQVYHFDGHTYRNDYGLPHFARDLTPRNESGFQTVTLGGGSFAGEARSSISSDEPNNQFFASYALAQLTVAPVFRWEANRLYTEENPEGAPDPADTPPDKLWYYEQSDASTLYPNAHFEMEEVSNGLGTEAVISYPYGPSYTQTRASKLQVVVQDTGGATTVYGHSRSLVVRVKLTTTGIVAQNVNYDSASVNVNYAVDLVQFYVMSRLKADHDPTDLYTGFSNPFDFPKFGAHIAAGGIETSTHEHEADFAIMVRKVSSTTPLPDVPRSLLPRLRIRNREGVEVPLDIREQEGTTNANGVILSDTALSRDRTVTTYYPSHPVDAYLGNVPYSSWTRLFMEWGTTEWKMGENGEKEWNTNFLFNGGDYTEWLWAKTTTVEAKPLSGHTMKLLVERMELSSTDEQTGEPRTTIYTTDPAEVAANEGDSGVQVIYQDDLSDLVTDFLTLPDEMSDAGDGVYKGQITIKNSEDFSVEDLKMSLEDQGVYQGAE